MEFQVAGTRLVVDAEALIVAGFTGRDHAAVKRHLEELAREGVAPPHEIPCFYVLPPAAATQEERVVVLHEETSGEAEVALVTAGGNVYVTLGLRPHRPAGRDARHRPVQAGLPQGPRPVRLGLRRGGGPLGPTPATQLDRARRHAPALSGGDYRLPAAPERPRGPARLPPHTAGLGASRRDRARCRRHLPLPRFWAELHDPATNRTIDLHYTVSVLNPLQL